MSTDPRAQAKADLIYAILSMDSYNRGYGAGISDLAQSTGTKIDTWEITKNADDSQALKTAFNAGFYAIAYKNTTTGETVISYRGTDFIARLGLNPLVSPDFGGSDPTKKLRGHNTN
jgi:hypothetical protein